MSCVNCSCNKYAKLGNRTISEHPLMIIGECPTVSEVKRNTCMLGPGANVLKETMIKVGLPIDEKTVYWTTALKCAISKKKGAKFPSDAPVCCREALIAEIRAVKPRLLLVCGASAMQTLTGDLKIKISTEYGSIREYDYLPGIQVIPIMNPGALIHKPGDYKPFLSTIELAYKVFNGTSNQIPEETTWTVVKTKEEAEALWVKMHNEYKAGLFEYAGYDIETTDLDYRFAEFCVLGICYQSGHAYVIPRELKDVVHNFLDNSTPWKKIWQHGKYDKKVSWRRELGTVSIDADTMYEHYMLDETTQHDLGYLAKTFLNAPDYKYKMNQNFKAVTLETYSSFFESLCERVAVDCNYTLQLNNYFLKELAKPENACLLKCYNELIIPAANFLARVEQNGMLIDAEFLDEMDKKYQVILQGMHNDIEDLAAPYWDRDLYMAQTKAKSAPVKFNPAASQQMSWMVFDRLKLKPRVKKGRSCDKDVLKTIENPPALILKVQEFRKVQKEHSTYVLGLLKLRDTDGCVRTNFSLHITATGRLSSKEPNVQNQPSANGVGNIRKAFIAPKGYILAEIDYSGAELRWLAFLSGCPVLSQVFIEGRNLHHETATSLFGEHYTKKQKMRAKAVNFGIPYGIGAKSIADEHNISVEEAQEMIDGWNRKYYGAAKYLEWCAEQVRLGHYLETPWGRRRRFGLVTEASLSGLENESKNFPIQSSSSDGLLDSAIIMEDTLLQQYDTRIIDLIHDSVLMVIPAKKEIVQAVGTYANQVMCAMPKKFNCPIPFKTDFEIGINWGEVDGCAFNTKTGKVEIEDKKTDIVTEWDFDEWYAMSIKKQSDIITERRDMYARTGQQFNYR